MSKKIRAKEYETELSYGINLDEEHKKLEDLYSNAKFEQSFLMAYKDRECLNELLDKYTQASFELLASHLIYASTCDDLGGTLEEEDILKLLRVVVNSKEKTSIVLNKGDRLTLRDKDTYITLKNGDKFKITLQMLIFLERIIIIAKLNIIDCLKIKTLSKFEKHFSHSLNNLQFDNEEQYYNIKASDMLVDKLFMLNLLKGSKEAEEKEIEEKEIEEKERLKEITNSNIDYILSYSQDYSEEFKETLKSFKQA